MLNTHYIYLLIDVLCILVPLLASFHPLSPFYKDWKYYLPVNLFVSMLFLVWDAAFTQMGIWGFNNEYISGINLFNLPIEEVLFFICIPYACTYTYYVFSRYVQIDFPVAAKGIAYILAGILFIIALFHYSQLYTSVTFILLAVLLVGVARASYLSRFFVVYAIMLIPFFISNGILTGSMLDKPVVWYNNHYNMGIRILTIPIEDFFYAMLLLLLNISGYEWMKKKYIKKREALQ